ncbi:MAG: hypothetical protein IJW64_02115 [Clostridia bacterium]|nr:hypothetical protein [Clostridia bacterium]
MKKIKISQKQYEDLLQDQNSQDLNSQSTDGSESQEKEDLKEQIEQINDEYENTTTRTYGDVVVPQTQEKVYEMPSIEETTQKATEEIEPLYDAKKESIETQGEIKTQALEQEKDEFIKAVEDSLKTLNSSYDKAKDSASNEALKRGLARSSIILNQLDSLEKGRVTATGEVLSERDKKIASIMDEVEKLKLEIENDVNVLTEEKVKKINERVNELVEKYQKEQDDVFEYNNKVRKEKAETLAKLKEAGIDATEENSKEYIKMIADKTKAFYSYYYSLGKNAKSELEKDREFVEEQIGARGYQSLMRYFN